MLELRQDGKIRRFTDDRIRAAVDNALAQLSDDDQVATVAHAAWKRDGSKFATLSIAARDDDGEWTVMAGGYADWTHELDVGVEAKVVWKPGWLT
jgi:hypothetical protein